MDLFSDDKVQQILPHDGSVYYYGCVMRPEEADYYYRLLLDTLEWKHDEAFMLGKRIITPRKVAWYGDREFSYTYSNITKRALPWTAGLLELKKRSEELTGASFNSCLANLYHNGNEGMAWHSDDEKTLGKHMAIASLSFGAERNFSFKHKRTQERISLLLAHGSLLVMKDETQSNWMHRLPPTTKVKRPRINLTFRTIADD